MSRPLDWALDLSIDFAVRHFQITSFWPLHSIPDECQFEVSMANWHFERTQSTARNWCGMSEARRADCLSMLDWTSESVISRLKTCKLRAERHDGHILTPIVREPCPKWQPDASVVKHLVWASRQAEKIDRGAPAPSQFSLMSLDRQRTGDLVVGLKCIEILFSVKQTEKAVATYVSRFNLARSMAKVSFIVPPIFKWLFPKLGFRWLPFSSAALLAAAAALYIVANSQFHRQMLRCCKIETLFSEAICMSYRNYHISDSDRERESQNPRERDGADSQQPRCQEGEIAP